MLEWGTPLWLAIGIAAMALVWWLHRFNQPDSTRTVSAGFLWDTDATEQNSGARRARADPRWRLRALAALCLCLAMAQPHWPQGEGPNVEAWFDDTLSMQALETKGLRSRLATQRLLRALAEAGPGRVTVHALGTPGRTLTLDPYRPAEAPERLVAWLRFGAPEVLLPLPVQMTRTAEHWLVSDGADPAVGPWLATAPVARVIRIGAATENVAITLLSVRRSLRHAGALAGLVEVANLGNEPAARRLTVSMDEQPVEQADLRLEPGRTYAMPFALPVAQNPRLQAAVGPGDALAVDDGLSLDLAAISPAAVRVHGPCGPALRAALLAHPAIRLAVAGDSSAALTIACAPQPPSDAPALIRTHRADDARPVTAPLVWHPDAGPLRELILEAAWLRQTYSPPPGLKLRPLLLAGDQPLIFARPKPERLIEVGIDLESPELVRRPEFPALVAGLLDTALQRSLLDQFANASRSRAASTIKPLDLPRPQSASSANSPVQARDLTAYVIAIACVLLLVELTRAGRRASGG